MAEFDSLPCRHLPGVPTAIPVPRGPSSLAPPFRSICKLVIECPDGVTIAGTGWLLGAGTVITAAHNLYPPHVGGYASRVRVFPGLDGEALDGGLVSYDLATPPAWRQSFDPAADYGALFLGAAIEPVDFSCAAASDDELAAAELLVAGYPTDEGGLRQRWQKGKLAPWGLAGPGLIRYRIDTFDGDSGAPVWVSAGAEQRVVAIHVSGSDQGNEGVRITPSVRDDLLRWQDGIRPM